MDINKDKHWGIYASEFDKWKLYNEAMKKLDAVDKILSPNTDPWKQLADIRGILDS